MDDTHLTVLFGTGCLLLLAVWLPLATRRLPLSLPIVCVGLGWLAGRVGIAGIDARDLVADLTGPTALHVLEAVLIVSLMGTGLRIDRAFALRRWGTTWRLLGLAMPLTILAMTGLGTWALGLPAAAALLLAGMLSPTDPVLAADVQVGPPRTGEDGEVRFGLTTEAGLNDGLAAPFLALGVALVEGPGQNGWAWFGWTEAVWGLGGAVLVGYGLGRGFGWLSFRLPALTLAETRDGLVAAGAALVTYAVATALGANGFVAVFVAALALRSEDPEHGFHEDMSGASEQIERVLVAGVLLVFGAAIAGGLLNPLTLADAAVALGLILVVRPAAAWASLVGSPHPWPARALMAFFGIRGIGTLYYLVEARQEHGLPEGERIGAIVGLVVLVSILLHGATSTPLMRASDERREMQGDGTQGDKGEQDGTQGAQDGERGARPARA